MEIKNRQKLLLIVAGAGLFLLVADSLIVTPLTASWNERGRRVAELKKSVSNGQQLLKSNPQLSPDRKAAVQKLMADVMTTLGNQRGTEGARKQ